MAGTHNSTAVLPSGQVISVQNFNTSIPTLNPNGSPLFALVDMGSNGIRFSISDLSPPTRLMRCVYRERAGISLYDALHTEESGEGPLLFPAAIITTVALKCLTFSQIATKFNVPGSQFTVFATEAMRTAQNQAAMLSAIAGASNLSVSILAPQVESLFGALGARSAFHHVDGIFLDLGGGSVQMTYLNSRIPGYDVRAATAATSMPYGAAKLTAALTDPAAAAAAEADLKARMTTAFESLKARFETLAAQASSPAGVSIYICGGGFRGYGSMLMATHAIQPYPIPVIGGFTVTGDAFSNWQGMVTANAGPGKIFGLSKRRRAQFPAIAVVIKALISSVGKIDKATFCAGGNREGVVFAMLPTAMQETDPISFYPGADKVSPVLKAFLTAAIPPQVPALFTPVLMAYLLGATWEGLGDADDANSARTLHEVISGNLAGLPGLKHDGMAAVALTMCTRFGADLGPVDKALFENLGKLLGDDLLFWSSYLGTVLRFMGGLWPLMPSASEVPLRLVHLTAERSTTLGKNKNKSGIKVTVNVAQGGMTPSIQELVDMFKDVKVADYRVEAAVILYTTPNSFAAP